MCKSSKDLIIVEDSTDLDNDNTHDDDNHCCTFTLFDITLNIYL